ncbi:DUF2624 domain-containing protein [Sporolactobacillus kofuensis]|uniref:DUF2624 domain-containing protein n=1 Tax=Sporolactobacillus kofuensis TaxID=269672 RepID=A0ABW1W8R9_9BACL|nr:DUF2624 domain-containing protein [Sporolactobacillus kofuensis]
MNPFIEQMVIQKMNQLTPDELLHYAVQYGIPITEEQASQVTKRIHNKQINPFKPEGQKQLRKILDEVIDPELAESLEKQFEQLAKRL